MAYIHASSLCVSLCQSQKMEFLSSAALITITLLDFCFLFFSNGQQFETKCPLHLQYARVGPDLKLYLSDLDHRNKLLLQLQNLSYSSWQRQYPLTHSWALMCEFIIISMSGCPVQLICFPFFQIGLDGNWNSRTTSCLSVSKLEPIC